MDASVPPTIKHAGSLAFYDVEPPFPAKLLFWAVVLLWTALAFRAVRRGRPDNRLGLWGLASLAAIAVSNYLTIGWRPEYARLPKDFVMMWGFLTLEVLVVAGAFMILAAMIALISRVIWKPKPFA